MKILYVTTIGMTMRFFEDFIEELVRSGHQVDIATNEDPEKGGYPVPDKYKELGCKVYHIDIQRTPFSGDTFKAIKQLRELVAREEYDIVHCHTPVAGVCTRIACKNLREQRANSEKPLRVFYTAHGFHFYDGAPLKNWILYYPAEKICSKYTDTLITINKEDFERAKQKFNNNGKCKVEYIPGVGIDVDKFANTVVDRDKKREEIGVPKDAFMLLSVGELNKNKNHQIVVKALGKLKEDGMLEQKNIHYVIAGEGDEKDNLIALAKQLGVENRLHLLGQRTDCPELYKTADLFVHPSIREGLPVSVMEAEAAGLPVIGSDIRGNKDLIPVDNIFIQTDEETIVHAIQATLKNNQRHNATLNVGKSVINEQYTRLYLKQHILKVIHLLNTNKYSGAENVACQIIKMFKNDDGFDMSYCSIDGPIRETLQEKEVDFIPISRMSVMEIRRVIKEYNPDIIHAHDMRATLFAALASNKVKIISHVHVNNIESQRFSIRSLAYLVAYPRLKHIFWVSRAAEDGYYYKNLVSKKSSVLYNVIDKREIYEKANKDNTNYNFDIIYLGRLSEQKDPLRLIGVLNSICSKSNITAAIVGDGPLMHVCNEKIHEYGIADKVKMFGNVKNPYKILKCAKVLIMTSKYEGLPMCALEAQALGVPIVATPTDGLKEIVLNGYNGFLTEDDKKIATEISKLVCSEEYLSSFKECSKERFDQYNNIELYKNSLLDQYTMNC